MLLECGLYTAVCCQCVSENYLYRGYKHACSVCTSVEVVLTFNTPKLRGVQDKSTHGPIN